jgi:hypothetical protein
MKNILFRIAGMSCPVCTAGFSIFTDSAGLDLHLSYGAKGRNSQYEKYSIFHTDYISFLNNLKYKIV